jgi:HPt (histidine-containing phosphotransfer) domain-containing protein
MSDYLRKPFSFSELKEIVARWLSPGTIAQGEETTQSGPGPDMVPIVDTEALERLRSLGDGEGSFVQKVIRVYLENSPSLIQALDGARTTRQVEAVKRAAHSLKSSSANVGALRLVEKSKRLEADADHGYTHALDVLIEEIKAEYRLVESALRELAGRRYA